MYAENSLIQRFISVSPTTTARPCTANACLHKCKDKMFEKKMHFPSKLYRDFQMYCNKIFVADTCTVLSFFCLILCSCPIIVLAPIVCVVIWLRRGLRLYIHLPCTAFATAIENVLLHVTHHIIRKLRSDVM